MENFNIFFFNLLSLSNFFSTEKKIFQRNLLTTSDVIFFSSIIYSLAHELPLCKWFLKYREFQTNILYNSNFLSTENFEKKYTFQKIRYVLSNNVSTENVILRSLEKSYGEFLKWILKKFHLFTIRWWTALWSNSL